MIIVKGGRPLVIYPDWFAKLDTLTLQMREQCTLWLSDIEVGLFAMEAQKWVDWVMLVAQALICVIYVSYTKLNLILSKTVIRLIYATLTDAIENDSTLNVKCAQ